MNAKGIAKIETRDGAKDVQLFHPSDIYDCTVSTVENHSRCVVFKRDYRTLTGKIYQIKIVDFQVDWYDILDAHKYVRYWYGDMEYRYFLLFDVGRAFDLHNTREGYIEVRNNPNAGRLWEDVVTHHVGRPDRGDYTGIPYPEEPIWGRNASLDKDPDFVVEGGGQYKCVTTRPIVDVSDDGGSTWQGLSIPLVEGYNTIDSVNGMDIEVLYRPQEPWGSFARKDEMDVGDTWTNIQEGPIRIANNDQIYVPHRTTNGYSHSTRDPKNVQRIRIECVGGDSQQGYAYGQYGLCKIDRETLMTFDYSYPKQLHKIHSRSPNCPCDSDVISIGGDANVIYMSRVQEENYNEEPYLRQIDPNTYDTISEIKATYLSDVGILGEGYVDPLPGVIGGNSNKIYYMPLEVWDSDRDIYASYLFVLDTSWDIVDYYEVTNLVDDHPSPAIGGDDDIMYLSNNLFSNHDFYALDSNNSMSVIWKDVHDEPQNQLPAGHIRSIGGDSSGYWYYKDFGTRVYGWAYTDFEWAGSVNGNTFVSLNSL